RAVRVHGARRCQCARSCEPLRPAYARSNSMTANVTMESPHLGSMHQSRSRRVRNHVATGLIILSFLVALVPLVAVVIYVVQQGAEQLSWDFVTEPIPISDRLMGGGMGPAVVGTIVITLGAAVLSIPLGILGGIYLNEYGKTNPFARLV